MKTNKATAPPAPSGWTYVEITHNLYTPCDKCGKLLRDMFYKSVRAPGGAYHTTVASCGPCLWKKDNG